MTRTSFRPVRRPRRPRAFVVLGLALVLASAGCSNTVSSDSGDPSDPSDPSDSGRGGTLTFAYPAGPSTLDPAKTDQAFAVFIQPAYDPLIKFEADGSYAPALATEWGYVGEGNTEFELELRDGVEFSDGTVMTAEGIKQYLEYARDAAGPQSAWLAGAEIATTGPLGVTITLAEPYPLVPFMLSQYNTIGSPVSPEALAQPDALGTETAGVGKYVLDPDETVSGDHYTYVRNESYYDQDAIRYDTMVLRVIENANSALNALRTDQVDVAIADISIADGAERAGLNVITSPFLFQGLLLADRGGTLSAPLADLRVRQALNYAVDREAVTTAVVGKYGVPTTQTVPDGHPAWSQESADMYPYDPDKARELLAEAGYPDGFELDVLSNPTANIGRMSEALSGQLAEVGVQLNIVEVDPNAYFEQLLAAQYPAASVALGAGSMTFEYSFLFSEVAPFNPFRTTDPELTDLSQRMLTADDAERAIIDKEIAAYLVREAWMVPVSFVPLVWYANDTVTGIDLSPANPLATITDWSPA